MKDKPRIAPGPWTVFPGQEPEPPWIRSAEIHGPRLPGFVVGGVCRDFCLLDQERRLWLFPELLAVLLGKDGRAEYRTNSVFYLLYAGEWREWTPDLTVVSSRARS